MSWEQSFSTMRTRKTAQRDPGRARRYKPETNVVQQYSAVSSSELGKLEANYKQGP